MAKLFNGMIPFASAIQPTGAQPLDDRTVVKSFSDLLNVDTFVVNGASAAYNGMLVSVIDEERTFMLVDNTNITNKESWVPVGIGNGSISVETYAEAIALASNDNVGQIIYVTTKSEYDSEGDGVVEEYDAAPYIVIGNGNLQKLASSSASGDIEGDVRELITKVSDLESVVGDETDGIVKDVNDLKAGTVKDVKFNGSTVVTDGVAEITVDLAPYALQSTLEGVEGRVSTLESGKVDKVEGSRLMTEVEGTKLSGIEEGAQVNIIESVKVNGTAVEVNAEDKSVNISIEAIKVKNVDGADKILSLTENGEVKSELSIAYLKSENSEDGKPYIGLYGKNGTTLISSIDATDFIKDGMISGVELLDNIDGKKVLRITWNVDSGKEVVDVDVTELLDYYYAGNGIAFDETERKFSVDLKDGEKYLVVDATGLGINETELWASADAKYDAKNSANTALESAKTYADGLNTAMDARVVALEGIDHSVYAKSEDVYTKDVADSTFVKSENFNEFTQELETKLEAIEEGAEVNIIESITVNGVEATVSDKNASVKVSSTDIEIGSSIKDGEEEKYSSDTKISVVLQGIEDSVREAHSASLKSVSSDDTAINVNNTDAKNPVISLNVETATETTIGSGHVEIVKGDQGVYGVMYYGGDDAE